MGIIFEVVYPLVYAAIVFVAIIAVIFFIIGATHLSSKIFSGRRMVLLQPSTILAYFALVVCFAGHVDHVNAQFFYAKGKCLNEANNGDPGCNAKEVTPSVTGIDGPSTCTRGTIIKVNITLSMDFNAERFDLGIYLGLNGTSARTGTNTCLVQSLGPADAGPTVSNVDGDKCWDSAAGISTIVIKNADILCNDTDNSGKVTFKSCFVWKTKGPNTNCNASFVLLSIPDTVSSDAMFGLLKPRLVISHKQFRLWLIINPCRNVNAEIKTTEIFKFNRSQFRQAIQPATRVTPLPRTRAASRVEILPATQVVTLVEIRPATQAASQVGVRPP